MMPDPQITIFVDSQDNELPETNGQIMVCAVCQTPLNKLTADDDPDGEFTWLHSRAWRHYDHDPVPELADIADANFNICDFCGTETTLTVAYVGDRLRIRSADGTLNDFGTTWRACDPCTGFIDAADLDGLLHRALRVSEAVLGKSRTERQAYSQSWLHLWRACLPTIRTRTYIGPQRIPAKLNPRMMPKLQHGLVKFWNNPTVLSDLNANNSHTLPIPGLHTGDEESFIVRYRAGQPIPDTVWRNHIQHLTAGIWTGDLYWISDEFTRLAVMAGKDFDKLLISREELPSPFGFMVFAEPIGEIPRPYGTAAIRAVSWTLIPGGVWINLYIQGEDSDPDIDVEQMRQERGYLLCPNTGAGIVFDQEIPLDPDDEFPFITTLFATWFLMNQPGVAEHHQAPVDKKVARSYQREYKRHLPDVRLVDLRRQPSRPGTGSEHREGRQLTVRVYRKGHWKRQFYGPARSLRKTIYISPYIAGPTGAPLKHPAPVVKVVR